MSTISAPVISVKGISKRFCRDLKRSLMYGFGDIFRTGIGAKKSSGLRKDEFWAVKDISFELHKGQCLGLIGHNGAGKSTLLKMLNGIISPDEGEIRINGRVAALIELGAGFNPILTGKENIYNNGSVLGFTREEIDDKLEEIIEFSEIREFINMPVQNYSSGMKVRLGFSVAAHLNPDLLLIDEVLAVGDIGFRIKCYNKIANLLKDTAIIFVSHSMPQMAKISDTILLMNKGEEAFFGKNVSRGIEAYYDLFPGEQKKSFGDRIELQSIQLNGEMLGENIVECTHGENLNIKTTFTSTEDFKNVRVILQFVDKDMRPTATAHSLPMPVRKGELVQLDWGMEANVFSLGKYSLGMAFAELDEQGQMTQFIRRYVAIGEFSVGEIDVFSHASIELIGQWTVSRLESDSTEGKPDA